MIGSEQLAGTDLDRLLGADVIACEGRPTLAHEHTLFPDEKACIARAVDKRRAEFATARHLARTALAMLGVPAQSLCSNPDRSPRWPAGTIGSITHTYTYCAVAVAASSKVRSIGLDAEVSGALPKDLISIVCTKRERQSLALLSPQTAGHRAKLLFSGKEAFYKCQYPLTRSRLDFQDVELVIDEETGCFHAEVLRGLSLEDAWVTRAQGRYVVSDDLVITYMRLD